MIYLDPSEYAGYGLEAATLASWVTAASVLIEGHCRRPTLGVAQYSERLRLAGGRNTVRVTYLPLATVAPATSPLVAARARYALPRRGESLDPAAEVLAADVARVFALPGAWTALDAGSIDFCAETGELTLPVNALGLSFNEVEITYTAGWATIPDAAKFACAQIVRNAQATPALNVRGSAIEQMHLEYFSDSLLDSVVRELLAPYVAQKVG